MPWFYVPFRLSAFGIKPKHTKTSRSSIANEKQQQRQKLKTKQQGRASYLIGLVFTMLGFVFAFFLGCFGSFAFSGDLVDLDQTEILERS